MPQDDKLSLTTLRASAALPAAGAWDAALTAVTLDVSGAAWAEIDCTFTHNALAVGVANGAELMVERSPVSTGTDWQDAEEALDTSGVPALGVLVCPSSALHRSVAVVAATSPQTRTFRVPCYGADRIRVRAREITTLANPGTLVVRGRALAGG